MRLFKSAVSLPSAYIITSHSITNEVAIDFLENYKTFKRDKTGIPICNSKTQTHARAHLQLQ